nr:MAG TPA: hypothetical protein [Caudoviricetes sp.]
MTPFRFAYLDILIKSKYPLTHASMSGNANHCIVADAYVPSAFCSLPTLA